MARTHRSDTAPTTRTATALAPYGGPFGRAEAYHLLRRGTFGVRAHQVDAAVAAGLDATLDALARPDAAMAPPINYDFPDDPNVPVGATWVEAPYIRGVDVSTYRIQSYNAWLIEHFLTAGASLERRLMLFLVNHFGVAADGDVRAVYRWYELLRAGTTMPFDELVKAVTVHPSMLRFLDGATNAASSPNENYARELLELYTVGAGPQAAPGDYTYYTEADIREVARALTGWRIRGEWSDEAGVLPEAYYQADRHDGGEKRLSARLGGAVIAPNGEREYADVVDVIFAQPRAGHHVCRKLYRWFCHHDVSAAVERDVIAPMAEAFRDSGWRLLAPVRLLLASEHFFAAGFRGALVKSPLDEVCDLTTGLGFGLPDADDLPGRAWLLGLLNYFCGREGMALREPPSVAGWKAFHQEPLYNRFWINAATLESRRAHAGWTIWSGYGDDDVGDYPLDLLAYVATFDNPGDPNALVAGLAERLFPVTLSQNQLTALKYSLIPGLPDFEWTVEYTDHLDDPGDEMRRASVRGRLNSLFYAATNAAEFHLY